MKKQMKLYTNKIASLLIATILIVSIAASTSLMQTANAHTPPQDITTFAFISVVPNPVGVGQSVSVVMWAGLVLPGATVDNDVRFHDYQLVIMKPDGTNQTETWDTVTDTTSTQYFKYTPDQTGNYSFVFSYPDQLYTWNDTSTMRIYTNDTYLGATSKTLTITVQDEPIPDPINSYPLPTEYWTRPIEGQNTDWWTIASNWLGETHPKLAAGNRYQEDGLAPNSAHILWTKPIDEGGIVGGTNIGIEGTAFYSGLSYQARFTNPIIINGVLFYPIPRMNSGTGNGYIAVDLQTGEEVWYNKDMTSVPTFGYLYNFDNENQHGVIPSGLLFTSNFGQGYDASTGESVINITGVPSGVSVVGSNGEILRYVLTNKGNSTNPSYYLAQWNSSKVIFARYSIGVSQPSSADASLASCYDWNVSVTNTLPVGTSAQVAIIDDILIGTTPLASFSGSGTPDPYTVWALSLKPEDEGKLLWMQNYTAPDGVTRRVPTIDPVNRVLMFRDKETMVFQGYDLDSGKHLWTTKTTDDVSDFEYFDLTYLSVFWTVADGHLYHAGLGGVLYSYDTADGSLEWTYGNGGEGNSTDSGLTTAWGRYPQYIYAVADDKVFLMTGEHSPDSPLWKGGLVRAINATDGTEIWKLSGYAGYTARSYAAVADGIYVFDNIYNSEITAVGKGPSSMTVEAPMLSAKIGDSIVIRGTVTDISAGTTQKEQAARFPNGVAAVSDASQQGYMEYVYQQKPLPTDITGVPVTINVVDANGNFREIGTVTSDSDGFFSLDWKPDIEGKYTVYASFAGSESYWPSHAETAFVVDPAAATPTPTETPTSITDQRFVPAVAGIILAIAIVGVLLAILMLRKRP
jgi:hypothetical protein